MNLSNAQGGLSFLIAVLTLSKFPLLQCKTEGLCMLLGPNRKQGSKPNLMVMDRPRHPVLQVLIMPPQVQDLQIHDSYDCWFISCSFYVAHPLDTPVAMRTQHNSNRKAKRRPILHHGKHNTNKVNRMVNSRLSHHHRRLSLLSPPRLQHPPHILFQQVGSHTPSHYKSDSFFFSVVHLPCIQMGTSTAASVHLESGSFVIASLFVHATFLLHT